MCKSKVQKVIASGVLSLSIVLIGVTPVLGQDTISNNMVGVEKIINEHVCEVADNFIGTIFYNQVKQVWKEQEDHNTDCLKPRDIYTESTYKDVNNNHWYKDGACNCYKMGLMKGKGDCAFDPSGNVLVAEAISIASRVHALYNSGTKSVIPLSSEGDKWWQSSLDYATKNKIVKSSDFKTNDMQRPATREELAYILGNSLPDKELEVINKDIKFNDVKTSSKYTDEVMQLAKAGVIGGYTDGTFKPTQSISRAETAVIVNRLVTTKERVKQDQNKTTGTTVYVREDEITDKNGNQTIYTTPSNGLTPITVRYGRHTYNSNNQTEYNKVMEVVDGVINGTSVLGKDAYQTIENFKNNTGKSNKSRSYLLKHTGIDKLTSNKEEQDKLFTLWALKANAQSYSSKTLGITPDGSKGNSAYSKMFQAKGDCTADAMINLAVCDALGYNAKVVAGENHEWVKVQIDGKWYELDSAIYKDGAFSYKAKTVTVTDTFNNAK